MVGNYYFNETVADQFVTARPNQLHASTKILRRTSSRRDLKQISLLYIDQIYSATRGRIDRLNRRRVTN